METAKEFFKHELGDMLDAERKMLEIIEQTQNETNNPQMQKALEQHYSQTEGQIERLEQCFQELGEEPEESECKGVIGLRQEKETFMQEQPSEELIEAFNLGATLKTEHYEIAAYTALIDLAEKLDMRKAARLLGQNLREEQQMLKKAETIAQKFQIENTGMEEEEMEEAGEVEAAPRASRSRSTAASRNRSRTRRAA